MNVVDVLRKDRQVVRTRTTYRRVFFLTVEHEDERTKDVVKKATLGSEQALAQLVAALLGAVKSFAEAEIAQVRLRGRETYISQEVCKPASLTLDAERGLFRGIYELRLITEE